MLQNGAVVQTARPGDFSSFQAFKDQVLSLPIETSIDPTPSVKYTALNGDHLEFTYGKTPTVNGTPVDYEHWPLFDGPFLHAEEGSQQLEMQSGSMHRLLDFKNLMVKDWIEK